ncbi:hypothetical protein [Jeongeupia sp. USM3]|uniref:hypothetical protein n=1 Tax=Jeongeupia sp. USM3 TaxID=1906741 RepID=UPI00089DDAF8|nr:hypothetical protein [Jeongeupia sp. USM3]AOY00239.1 hypothetical protein BJP62_07145 [Jeongeupia sp. USM3]
MTITLPQRTLAALLVSALALNPALAGASPAIDTGALIGTSSDTAEQILQNNGYKQVHTENGSDRNWVSWWNDDSKDCLVTSVKNARYIAVQPTVAHECQQYAGSTSGHGTALALAAGAAALIGGIALYNHNKHRHDNDQSGQNDYQQGYQDGLDNRSSSNGGDAYTSGYNAGIDEYNNRHANRRHRHGRDRDAYVDVSDLVGVRASYAETDLVNRGFRNIDGSKGWHNAYTSWWNERANECVQVVTRDGRYDRVSVVDAGNCA